MKELFSKRENKVLVLLLSGAVMGIIQSIVFGGAVKDLIENITDSDTIQKVVFWLLCFPVMLAGNFLSVLIVIFCIIIIILAVLARLIYEPTGRFFRIYNSLSRGANINLGITTAACCFVAFTMYIMSFMMFTSSVLCALLVTAIFICMTAICLKVRTTLRVMASDCITEESLNEV